MLIPLGFRRHKLVFPLARQLESERLLEDSMYVALSRTAGSICLWFLRVYHPEEGVRVFRIVVLVWVHLRSCMECLSENRELRNFF